LPTDVTCTRCTLQVLEFMTAHGAPCFYHHCADISIAAPSGSCEVDGDCNDGVACTRDVCGPTQECIAEPLTLDDVDAGFLGTIEAPACTTEPVPGAIANLFGKADTLVLRAADTPTKATRYLNRAAKRLRRAAAKVDKIQGKRISTECSAALGAILQPASARVQCLLGAAGD
jgi:hypothetical protein